MPVSRLARLVRDELVEGFETEFFLLARTKGLSTRQCVVRHLLRNSITPILPEILTIFFIILNGSFFVELTYGVRGVGYWLFHDVFDPIFDVYYINFNEKAVVLISAFYSFLGMFAILLLDLSYSIVDPRISIGHTKM